MMEESLEPASTLMRHPPSVSMLGFHSHGHCPSPFMKVEYPEVDRPEVDRPEIANIALGAGSQQSNPVCSGVPAAAPTAPSDDSKNWHVTGGAVHSEGSEGNTITGLVAAMAQGHRLSGATAVLPVVSEDDVAERKEAEKSVTAVRSPRELDGERVGLLCGDGVPVGIALISKALESTSQECSNVAVSLGIQGSRVAVECRLPLFLGMAANAEDTTILSPKR